MTGIFARGKGSGKKTGTATQPWEGDRRVSSLIRARRDGNHNNACSDSDDAASTCRCRVTNGSWFGDYRACYNGRRRHGIRQGPEGEACLPRHCWIQKCRRQKAAVMQSSGWPRTSRNAVELMGCERERMRRVEGSHERAEPRAWMVESAQRSGAMAMQR